MTKRILIVLGFALGLVLIPWFLGYILERLIHVPIAPYGLCWIGGILVLCGAAVLSPIVSVLSRGLFLVSLELYILTKKSINWIKYGKFQ